jgi:uncharacterized protein YicC (UPF0701 family)
MRRIATVVVVAIGLLAGCGEKPQPTPSMPVESAGQAMRRDNEDIAKRLAEQKAGVEAQYQADRLAREKQAHVAALQGAATKWVAAVDAAIATGRSNLSPAIDKMTAAKEALAAVETNDCTASVKAAMLAAADKTLGALNQFRSETGAGSDATKQQLSEASSAFLATDAALRACR